MKKTVLKVNGLHKKYYSNNLAHSSFLQDISRWFNLKFSNHSEENQPGKSFWAIKDINFELEEGDVLGVIGKNGSGKSTLLKVLSQITPPTKGHFEYSGVLSSILEIGTGFHGDLSGRENIYMNAGLLGLKKSKIDSLYPEIVEFSGIGEFIDHPVKHYSQGMYLRLAFSIAFHCEVDILLLDEVLAVGDAEFKLKSMKKIQELINDGATLILVSHSMNEILQLCNKCLLLKDGEIKAFGPPSGLINTHLKDSFESFNVSTLDNETGEIANQPSFYHSVWNENAPGNEIIRLKEVSITVERENAGNTFFRSDAIIVKIVFHKLIPGINCQVMFNLFDHMLNPVMECSMISFRRKLDEFNTLKSQTGVFECTCLIPSNFLTVGIYSINLSFIDVEKRKPVFSYMNTINFQIQEPEQNEGHISETPFALSPAFEWDMKKIKDLD